MAIPIEKLVQFDPQYFTGEPDEDDNLKFARDDIVIFLLREFIRPHLDMWKPVLDLKSITPELARKASVSANTFRIFEGFNPDPSLYDLKSTVGDCETIKRIAEGIHKPQFADTYNFDHRTIVNREHPFPGIYIFFPHPVRGNPESIRNHYGAEYKGGQGGIERYALPQEMAVTAEIDAAVWDKIINDPAASRFIAMQGPRRDLEGRNVPETIESRLGLVDEIYRNKIVFLYFVPKRDPHGRPYDNANLEPVAEIINNLELEKKMAGSGPDNLARSAENVARTSLDAAVSFHQDMATSSTPKSISDSTKKKLEAFGSSVVDLSQVYLRYDGDLEPYIQSASELTKIMLTKILASVRSIDESSKQHIRKVLDILNQKMLLGIATIYHLGEKYPELRQPSLLHEASIAYNLGDFSLMGIQGRTLEKFIQRVLTHPDDTARLVREAGVFGSRTDFSSPNVYRLIELAHTDKLGYNSVRIGDLTLDLRPDFKAPISGPHGKIHQISSLIESVLMGVEGLYAEAVPDYLFPDGKELSPFKAMDKISRSARLDADVIRAFAEVSGLFPSGTLLHLKFADKPQTLLWYSPDGRLDHSRAIEPQKPRVREFYALVNSQGFAIPYKVKESPESRLATDLGGVTMNSILLYSGRDKGAITNNGAFNREAFEWYKVVMLPHEAKLNGK